MWKQYLDFGIAFLNRTSCALPGLEAAIEDRHLVVSKRLRKKFIVIQMLISAGFGIAKMAVKSCT